MAAETTGIYRFVMSFSKSGMVLHVHHPGTVRLQQEDCHEPDASLGHTVTSRPANTIKYDFGQLCQGGHTVLLGLPTIFLFTDSVSFFLFLIFCPFIG